MAAFYLRSFPMVASIPPDHDSLENFQIDQIGFSGGALGEVIVDPDFAEHLVNELLWKSLATRVFPDTLVDRVSIMVPSSANEYSRAGISADLMKEKNYRVTINWFVRDARASLSARRPLGSVATLSCSA